MTAEGVETAEQLGRLEALGCLQAQGYLFSPAVPSAELPALLAAAGLPAPSGLAAA